MSYLQTSTVRLAAIIHDALRDELEAQAELGGQIHLHSVRSLFRQWEFQPSEVHELFRRVATRVRQDAAESFKPTIWRPR